MKQERIKPTVNADHDKAEEPQNLPSSTKKGDDLKAELDELLDEIDTVLEEDAQSFVAGYIQKGGQ